MTLVGRLAVAEVVGFLGGCRTHSAAILVLIGGLGSAKEIGFLGHGRADDAPIFVLDLGLFAPEKVRLGRGGRPHRLV